jgi:hypothetical protein
VIKKIILLIILILPILVNAQRDHLQPIPSIYDIRNEYLENYIQFREIILKELSNQPIARLIIRPTFSPESVLEITYDYENERYIILYRKLLENFSNSKKQKKIKSISIKKDIDKESAELISKLFITFIDKSKYKVEDKFYKGVSDGITYYFSAFNDNIIKSGKVKSPEENTQMSELVNISSEIIKYVENTEENITLPLNIKRRISDLIIIE